MRVIPKHTFKVHRERLIEGKVQKVAVKFRGAEIKIDLTDHEWAKPGVEIDVLPDLGKAMIAAGAAVLPRDYEPEITAEDVLAR